MFVWMIYEFLTQDLCGFEVVWLHGFTITAALGEKKSLYNTIKKQSSKTHTSTL